jgi:hypothetical protein
MEVSGQFHAPCRFTPGTHRRWGWVDSRAGLENTEKWKFLTYRDSNSDPSVVLPIASRYTYCATAAHMASKIPTWKYVAGRAACFPPVFTFGLFFDHSVPPKRRLAYKSLHGVISQKILLFLTSDVRTKTSNLTQELISSPCSGGNFSALSVRMLV